VTGTLEYADLAVKIAEVPALTSPLVGAGEACCLLLVVFGLKAASPSVFLAAKKPTRLPVRRSQRCSR